jgi:hypothetical protein
LLEDAIRSTIFGTCFEYRILRNRLVPQGSEWLVPRGRSQQAARNSCKRPVKRERVFLGGSSWHKILIHQQIVVSIRNHNHLHRQENPETLKTLCTREAIDGDMNHGKEEAVLSHKAGGSRHGRKKAEKTRQPETSL